MRIGAVSGYGSMYSSMMNISSNYKINSIYGNPKSLDPVGKIGQGGYSGNPFAVVSKKDNENVEADDEVISAIRQQQDKPFDFTAAMQRASQGLTSAADSVSSHFNVDDAMGRLMQGTRFSADTIPVVELN